MKLKNWIQAASAFGLGLSMVPHQADAQTPVRDENAPPAAEIVVTGERRALQGAINLKRDIEAISDSVSADEIGRLPDFAFGDALVRIPGVVMQQNNLRGASQFVTIRGLNSTYNQIQIDGVPLPGTEFSRRNTSLDILPASIATSVTVFKTFTPDQDANAIGGIVNLRTRSAFDEPGPYFSIVGNVGLYENKTNTRDDFQGGLIEGAFATQFGPGDRWGLVLAANYFRRDTSSLNSAIDIYNFYDAAGVVIPRTNPAAAEGIASPDRRRWLTYDNLRQRYGAFGKLEYRDFERLDLSLTAAFFEEKNDELRDSIQLFQSGAATNVTPTGGSVARGTATADQFFFEFPRNIAYVDGSGRYALGALDEIEFKANFAVTDAELVGSAADYVITAATPALAYDYQINPGDFPFFGLRDPSFAQNPQNYLQSRVGTTRQNNHEEMLFLRVDYRHNKADDALGWGWETGLSARLLDRTYEQAESIFNPLVPAEFPLSGAVLPTRATPYNGRGQTIFLIDRERALGLLGENPTRYRLAANNVAQNLQADNEVAEDVIAGYGSLSHRGDNFFVIGGLRYETTQIETAAYRRTGAGAATVYTWTKTPSEYDHWLPSINATYEFSDTLRLRAAASRSLGRPSYNDLAAFEAVTESPGTISISRGNPGLVPRQATNLDLSLEWEIGPGLISVAAFRKEVSDEIIRVSSSETINVNGVPTLRTISEPRNLDDQTINGIEIGALIPSLDGLPAPFNRFGFSANMTLLDAAPPSVRMDNGSFRTLRGLVEGSDETYNAKVFYDFGFGAAELAYNRVSPFYAFVSTSSPLEDRTVSTQNTWDAQVRFQLNDHASLIFQGRNLTNDRPVRRTGPSQNLTREELDNGAAYFVGFSYRN